MYFLQNTKRHRYDGMTHNIKVQYFEDKSCITKTCRMLGILNSSNILIQSTTITTTCEQLLVLYAYTCKKLYFCFVLFLLFRKQAKTFECLPVSTQNTQFSVFTYFYLSYTYKNHETNHIKSSRKHIYVPLSSLSIPRDRRKTT